jgi:hypothetical protein
MTRDEGIQQNQRPTSALPEKFDANAWAQLKNVSAPLQAPSGIICISDFAETRTTLSKALSPFPLS